LLANLEKDETVVIAEAARTILRDEKITRIDGMRNGVYSLIAGWGEPLLRAMNLAWLTITFEFAALLK